MISIIIVYDHFFQKNLQEKITICLHKFLKDCFPTISLQQFYKEFYANKLFISLNKSRIHKK